MKKLILLFLSISNCAQVCCMQGRRLTIAESDAVLAKFDAELLTNRLVFEDSDMPSDLSADRRSAKSEAALARLELDLVREIVAMQRTVHDLQQGTLRCNGAWQQPGRAEFDAGAIEGLGLLIEKYCQILYKTRQEMFRRGLFLLNLQ